jgi:hypothetical protein
MIYLNSEFQGLSLLKRINSAIKGIILVLMSKLFDIKRDIYVALNLRENSIFKFSSKSDLEINAGGL